MNSLVRATACAGSAAEPGKGYEAKAADWRAKLPPDDEAVEPAP